MRVIRFPQSGWHRPVPTKIWRPEIDGAIAPLQGPSIEGCLDRGTRALEKTILLCS